MGGLVVHRSTLYTKPPRWRPRRFRSGRVLVDTGAVPTNKQRETAFRTLRAPTQQSQIPLARLSPAFVGAHRNRLPGMLSGRDGEVSHVRISYLQGLEEGRAKGVRL